MARPERVIVVGEIHGTAEAPAAIGEMACVAVQNEPVIVALELEDTLQPTLDAFLAAPDAMSARAVLTGSSLLNRKYQDGRSSQAMLNLIERLRRLKTEGFDVSIHAFQPQSLPRGETLDQSWYELNMAFALAQARHQRPDARVMALMGNFHARKTPFHVFPAGGVPAAGHLPAGETFSLTIAQQGGSAWTCGDTECGAGPVLERYDPEARGVIFKPSEDGAYDGVLALGVWSASPPIDEAD
ncbi:hypothetical protein ACO2Q1_04275 [Brevundimonas sp. VNH65]|uniref:hypothetical protein n=1 Tax=Brevundimonas sp. VNH65 TaxID=3400917 RepID=UPI003BFA9118